jgi:hypothetical protein
MMESFGRRRIFLRATVQLASAVVLGRAAPVQLSRKMKMRAVSRPSVAARLTRALRAVLRVLAICLPVLAAFAGTVLLYDALLGWAWDMPPTSWEPLWLATVCGLITWLFIAAFHGKYETLTVTFADRNAFLGKLRAQLKDLGYDVRRSEADRQVFRPTFQALLFGGTIRVRFEEEAARLAGPKFSLELLRKRMRVLNHLEKDRKAFWDAHVRRNERLLNRVEISMRVTSKQWLDVYREVAQVLVREGAEVVFDVNLLAQSETGIRERTVEALIRDWVARENISALIRKERLSTRQPGAAEDSRTDGLSPSLEPRVSRSGLLCRPSAAAAEDSRHEMPVAPPEGLNLPAKCEICA